MTFSVAVQAEGAKGDPAVATGYTMRVLAIFCAEALTLSQQSAATTSLLLSATDFASIKMTGKAKEADEPVASISDYA